LDVLSLTRCLSCVNSPGNLATDDVVPPTLVSPRQIH
jgi:hypothetical protein